MFKTEVMTADEVERDRCTAVPPRRGNLYCDDQGGGNPMRIEHLFSKLESRASSTFQKIVEAVIDSRSHVDILEKNVHDLFKFMQISMLRSTQKRNEIENPRRENNSLAIRSRAKFERARRELDKFNQEREESWDRRGFRHENRKPPSPHHMDGGINEGKGVAEFDLSALGRFQSIIMPSREPVSRTKENALTCWQVFLTLDTLMHPGSDSREEDTKLWLMHPALQLAFEAAYPPKNRAHRDLVAIDFGEFFAIGLGEEHFTRLLNLVDERCRELVTSDTMDQHWAASKKTPSQPLETEASSEKSDHGKEKSKPRDEDPLANPAFKSAYRISQAFDSLRWMFEERQDILATFIQQLGESVENLRPTIVRMRARRE